MSSKQLGNLFIETQQKFLQQRVAFCNVCESSSQKLPAKVSVKTELTSLFDDEQINYFLGFFAGL